MTAVHMAAGQIALGAGEVFVCAGVEFDDPRVDGRLQSDAEPECRPQERRL